MTNLNGKSLDILQENIQSLKQLFPEVDCEGEIDFDKLKQILAEYTEDSVERYNFTWNGKGKALRLSQTPSQGTLRPCKEQSKDWDTTQNLYIEGDNLEVLKLLQKSYHGKVKIIYIDPPYNTGGDFVYPDDFKDSIQNYLELTGQVDSDNKKISTNSESNGRYHSDWLNMMYPRLRLARNLLTDDGVVFISIDDNEVDNLKKICNEVFGEDNFRNQIIVRRGAKSVQAQFETWDRLGKDTEYVLFYTKNAAYRFPKQTKKLGEARQGGWNNHWRGTDRPTMRYTIFGITPETGQWRWGRERSEKAIENYTDMLLKLSETQESITQEKIDCYYSQLSEEIDLLRLSKTGKPEHYIAPTDSTLLNSSWYDLLIGSSSEIMDLFEKKVFDTAKLTAIINRMLNFSDKNALILDFFSGSATTAHAVMQLNAEDGGNRKFICVQLPEPCKEGSEAFKAGYPNICEIGKERIRRAGDKIKQEKGLEAENFDIGFKVLKLDTSNIRKWQPDYEDLEQTLLDHIENYVDGRTELDVVYEIMLKYGLDLTYPVDEFTVAQKKVYSIGFGMLMICLDYEITTEVAKGILAQVNELAPESTRVVFKDNGFKTDSNKTNIKEILKCGGIEEFITL